MNYYFIIAVYTPLSPPVETQSGIQHLPPLLDFILTISLGWESSEWPKFSQQTGTAEYGFAVRVKLEVKFAMSQVTSWTWVTNLRVGYGAFPELLMISRVQSLVPMGHMAALECGKAFPNLQTHVTSGN